jgi:hypothetical protein
MAEIEKAIEEEEVITPDAEEVDIEIEGEEPSIKEMADAAEDFFKNLAEDMDDDVLQRMSNQLLDDYKKG